MSKLEKVITPEQVLSLVQTGEITYLELNQANSLDHNLVRFCQQLKSTTRLPLAVYSKNNSLSCLPIIDHFVADENTPKASLEDSDEAFFSNTHFINEDISRVTHQRILGHGGAVFRTSWQEQTIDTEKYIHPTVLPEVVENYQKDGLSVAVVAGIFDVLHLGHIRFLEEAKLNGNKLIVLINSDLSVSLQPKNQANGDRPINPLPDRVELLASLGMIDHIVPFDKPTVLELMQNLSEITYIKTQKDMLSDLVQQEKEAVLKRGGKSVVLGCLSDDKSAEVLSSTQIIKVTRQETPVEPLRTVGFEKYPSKVQEKISNILQAVESFGKTTLELSSLREALQKKYEGSLEECSQTELRGLGLINELSPQIEAQLGYTRQYHNFLIPFVLGKLLNLDLRVVPVQYNLPALPTKLINLLKLTDGRVVFSDREQQLQIGPLEFEKHFWKAVPHSPTHNASYEMAIKRLGIHPKKRHFMGLVLKILLEEYAQEDCPEPDIYKAEIIETAEKTWQTFDFHHEFSNDPIERVERAPLLPKEGTRLPGIVAHGGSSFLGTQGGFAENSPSGMQDALERGVDVLEIDTVACKDGWVVSHDRKLEIATNANGLTTNFTQEELKQVRIKLAGGIISKEGLMTLEEALTLVSKHRKDDNRSLIAKLDIKYSDPKLEKNFVDAVTASGLPLDRLLTTSQVPRVANRLHQLNPELSIEFNTALPNLYLLMYGIMDQEIIPECFIDYVKKYAPTINANTVSLMQFSLNVWGDKVAQRLIEGMHNLGLQTQVWVAQNMEDYLRDAQWGAGFVLMDNIKLISASIALKDLH